MYIAREKSDASTNWKYFRLYKTIRFLFSLRLSLSLLYLFGVISGTEDSGSDSDVRAPHRDCVFKIPTHAHGQL